MRNRIVAGRGLDICSTSAAISKQRPRQVSRPLPLWVEWRKGEVDVKNVSTLASVFGFLGCAPFVLAMLAVMLLFATNVGRGLPAGYLVMVVPAALAACFVLSAGNLLAWGVLRSLCEIEKRMGVQ